MTHIDQTDTSGPLAALHRGLRGVSFRAARDHGRAADHPGQPADLLALHRADPVLHLDRGDGALHVHLDDHDRRDDRRAQVDAFRGRSAADTVAARRGRGAAARPARRAGRGLHLRHGRHRVHALRVAAHLGTCRAAALVHPRRVAGDGRDLACVSRRTGAQPISRSFSGEPRWPVPYCRREWRR